MRSSFVVCAVLLARIRIPARVAEAVPTSYLRELRDGWKEFTAHTWLWSSVGVFGVSNMFYVGCWAVLGPEIADRQLGGAGAWAVILSAGGVGAVLGSIGLSVHLTLWFTVFQREIPERAQSRVSSYDALGSFVLVPLGMAFIGPIAAVTGTTAALWLAVAVFVGATAMIAAIPSVRAIRASAGEAGAAPTMAPR